jgi:hypothetical protein
MPSVSNFSKVTTIQPLPGTLRSKLLQQQPSQVSCVQSKNAHFFDIPWAEVFFRGLKVGLRAAEAASQIFETPLCENFVFPIVLLSFICTFAG